MSRKILTLIACLLLAACNTPGTQPSSQPQAWFDMPLPETVLYPPNPCRVVAHGASPNGIALFELFINSAFASGISASDSKQTLATLNIACPPLIPGKNLIELRVKDNTGLWSETTQTTVFLAQADSITVTVVPPRTTETPVSTLTATPTLTATLTPTLIPTLTPTFTLTPSPTFTSTPRATGGVTIERISTNLVYLGAASCGTREVTILARATAPNGIKVVVLFYRFQTANSSTEFQSVGMGSAGDDLYERTLNPTSLLGGSVPFDQATLQYQIVVQQNDGDTSIRTPVLADIAVQACGRVTTSCSSYTDERTCIANGCNWVNIPGTVPIFECRNP
jgi:hypothetical protein